LFTDSDKAKSVGTLKWHKDNQVPWKRTSRKTLWTVCTARFPVAAADLSPTVLARRQQLQDSGTSATSV